MHRTLKAFATVLTAATITAVASPAKAYSTAEADFLSDVYNGVSDAGYGSAVSSVSPATLLDLAYTACSTLDSGAPLSAVSEALLDSAQDRASLYLMSYTVGAGIQYLCPNHLWQVAQETQRIGQTREYYSPSTNSGSWARLTASDPGSQINVRSTPSLSASSPNYGLAGDRVWVTRSERHDGYNWYFVGFLGSGASGWVRGDFVRLD